MLISAIAAVPTGRRLDGGPARALMTFGSALPLLSVLAVLSAARAFGVAAPGPAALDHARA